MIFHCSFDLISLITYDIEDFFHVLFGHLYIFFGKIVSLDLPIFWLGCFIFFYTELYELFVYFGD